MWHTPDDPSGAGGFFTVPQGTVIPEMPGSFHISIFNRGLARSDGAPWHLFLKGGSLHIVR